MLTQGQARDIAIAVAAMLVDGDADHVSAICDTIAKTVAVTGDSGEPVA